jgi:hypothetical protein
LTSLTPPPPHTPQAREANERARRVEAGGSTRGASTTTAATASTTTASTPSTTTASTTASTATTAAVRDDVSRGVQLAVGVAAKQACSSNDGNGDECEEQGVLDDGIALVRFGFHPRPPGDRENLQHP